METENVIIIGTGCAGWAAAVYAGRADLSAKEKAELAVIQAYLPKAMSEAEAKAAIQALAKEMNLTSKKDMGTLMKAAMAKHKGSLDGKLAQKVLGEILT